MARSRKTDPSFARGFARSRGESANPESWEDGGLAFVPAAGNQGGTLYDLGGENNIPTINGAP